MVIGCGDIASVLTDRPDVIYFASGVSNSSCRDMREFCREYDLLTSQDSEKHLIYFSSLGIYYDDIPYLRHKRKMESVIRERFNSYTIFRIGNITWGKNPNTFINYLKSHPEAERKPVWRHLIDKEDFLYWVSMAPIGEKHEMNITGKRVWVPDLKL